MNKMVVKLPFSPIELLKFIRLSLQYPPLQKLMKVIFSNE
jgi:hypothetical protein